MLNDIFKGLLFLHGYRLPFESVEDSNGRIAGDYRHGYGNQVASERTFAPLGRTQQGRSRRVASRAAGGDICTAGGCG